MRKAEEKKEAPFGARPTGQCRNFSALTLSTLVGAIGLARAVADEALSREY
jgi:hypothetical protein